MKHYAQRDAYELDCENGIEGSYYSEHVSAMTSEGLHGKSDIAAELAVRDTHIEMLCNMLEEATGVSSEFTKKELPSFKIAV